MPEDDIIREIRKSREEFAARFNYDTAAMIRYLQEQERLHADGQVFIDPPPRPAKKSPPADRRQAG